MKNENQIALEISQLQVEIAGFDFSLIGEKEFARRVGIVARRDALLWVLNKEFKK